MLGELGADGNWIGLAEGGYKKWKAGAKKGPPKSPEMGA